MAGLQEASRLGISPFEETPPVGLGLVRTSDQIKMVIAAAYRQVFGNEYILASERNVEAESLLTKGEISVRDFVRALAESPLYREKFLFPNFHTRFIELNFKHFLGRSPYDQAEISEHTDLFLSKGYKAEIDSYLSSEEYLTSFGEDLVPFYRDFQVDHPGQRTVGFGRLLQLQRGYASSDRAQGRRQPRLVAELARKTVTPIMTASGSKMLSGGLGGSRSSVYRLRIAQKASSNSPTVRQATTELLVPYDQLTNKLQSLNRSGRKVVSVTAV